MPKRAAVALIPVCLFNSARAKAAHIESGIAYGLGKKCYAIGEYEATDSLYNIFEEIFNNETELEEFLKKYNA